MPHQEFFERRQQIEALVQRAPQTLRRTSLPAIVTMRNLPVVNGLNTFSPVYRDAFQAMTTLRTQTMPATPLASVSAKDMLLMGLETPKSVYDKDGHWFSQLNSIGLIPYLASLRYASQEPLDEQQRLVRAFHFRSQQWGNDVFRAHSSGQVWEQGVVVAAQNEVGAVSLSQPWDTTPHAWYRRLTQPAFYFETEQTKGILDDIAQVTTGMSREELRQQRMIQTTDEEAWWTEAKQLNSIVAGTFFEVDAQLGKPFHRKVMEKLTADILNNNVASLIQSADGIFGYYVTARQQKDSGNIAHELFIGPNWL